MASLPLWPQWALSCPCFFMALIRQSSRSRCSRLAEPTASAHGHPAAWLRSSKAGTSFLCWMVGNAGQSTNQTNKLIFITHKKKKIIKNFKCFQGATATVLHHLLGLHSLPQGLNCCWHCLLERPRHLGLCFLHVLHSRASFPGHVTSGFAFTITLFYLNTSTYVSPLEIQHHLPYTEGESKDTMKWNRAPKI